MASEIKLLSTTALKTSLDELLPRFERATGHKVTASYGFAAQLAKRIEGGEAADATILSGQALDGLAKQGKVVGDSRIDVARSAIMVAVKQGTRRPDVSSVEKFKQAMLAAKSIVHTDPAGGGTTGVHLGKIFAQLGIADALKPKTVYSPGGPDHLIGLYLVRGEAEIGIQQDSELMAVPGVDIAGPLPAEIQSVSVFAFGTLSGARDIAAARALGDFLRSSEALAVIKSKGMQPG